MWGATDPKGQYFNPYGYPTNPVLLVDPDGSFAIAAAVASAIIGAGIGTAKAIIEGVNEKQKFGEVVWGVFWQSNVYGAVGFGAGIAGGGAGGAVGNYVGGGTGLGSAIAAGAVGGAVGAAANYTGTYAADMTFKDKQWNAKEYWSDLGTQTAIGGVVGGVMGGVGYGIEQYQVWKSPTSDPVLNDINVRRKIDEAYNLLENPYEGGREHGFDIIKGDKGGGYATGKMQHASWDNPRHMSIEVRQNAVGTLHSHPSGDLSLSKGDIRGFAKAYNMGATRNYVMTSKAISGYYNTGGNISKEMFSNVSTIRSTNFWKFIFTF